MKRVTKKIKGKPFLAFVGKKLIFLFFALFIGMTLLFVFSHMMPSNPAQIMSERVGGGSMEESISRSTLLTPGEGTRIEVLKRLYIVKFGIKKSIGEKYLIFWKRFLTMDYGYSFWRYPHSVSSLLIYALPWTMALVLPVIPIGFIVGNWIGSRAAYYRNKVDRFLYYISIYLYRAPYFWFALILVLVFGTWLGWFPVEGSFGNQFIKPEFSVEWFLSALHHWTLPFISLLGVGIGGWAIGMRSMCIYEMESDYINYPKRLGFSKKKLRSYVERNAILPNFTWIPITLNALVGQTLLIEYIYGYEGLGMLFYEAAINQDYPLLEACFVVTLLLVLVGNFVADILYGKLDPRIASGYVSEG